MTPQAWRREGREGQGMTATVTDRETREHWEAQRRHIAGFWVALIGLGLSSLGTVVVVSRWSGDLDARLMRTETAIVEMDSRKRVTHDQHDQRIRRLEENRAGDAADIRALREELPDVRAEMRALADLIRGLERRYQNGSNP